MLKIMQTKLIHILGGYTKAEYKTHSSENYNYGYKKGNTIGYESGFDKGCSIIITKLMQTAINNYGCDKQSWIDAVYSDIKNIYNRYAK